MKSDRGEERESGQINGDTTAWRYVWVDVYSGHCSCHADGQRWMCQSLARPSKGYHLVSSNLVNVKATMGGWRNQPVMLMCN